jgi:hypothetical protein
MQPSCVLLGAHDAPLPQPQTYQGLSMGRRRKPSEVRIDEAWAAGDLDSTIEAVVDHVKLIHRDAPYLLPGTLNLPLADKVGMVILRSLPGYPGPEEPLSTFDGRIPLSSFCNMKAKQAHTDLCREYRTVKSHESLACELIRGEDFDVLTWLMQLHAGEVEGDQDKPLTKDARKQLRNTKKMKAQEKNRCLWRGQRYALYAPEILLVIAQSVSRLSEKQRNIIRQAENSPREFVRSKEFRAVERRLRRLALGWHSRVRKYPMEEVRSTVNHHGGVVSVYERFATK